MKKLFTIIVPLAALLVFAAQFSSCEKYVLPEMTLSEDSVYFYSRTDTVSIMVYSNVVWSFTNEDNNWYKGYPNWGDADSLVMFIVEENIDDRPREAELIIKTETISRTLHIFQEAAAITLADSSSSFLSRE